MIVIIIIIITRIKMYVCFGFSLARSRQARTIDLQCQSLSFRRAFLLRSVCLSLHLTVESFAVRWPTRSQNRSKITVKIDRKSSPKTPRSTQNRMKIASGTFSRPPVASKSVPKASKSVPRASQERPRARQERPKSGFIVSKWLHLGCKWLHLVVVQRRWEADGEGGER